MQPQDLTDTQVFELTEFYRFPVPLSPVTAAVTAEINLKRRYSIRYEYMPNGEVWVFDDNSFDSDPESVWNCIGKDRDPHEALLDLLDQIAEAERA